MSTSSPAPPHSSRGRGATPIDLMRVLPSSAARGRQPLAAVRSGRYLLASAPWVSEGVPARTRPRPPLVSPAPGSSPSMKCDIAAVRGDRPATAVAVGLGAGPGRRDPLVTPGSPCRARTRRTCRWCRRPPGSIAVEIERDVAAVGARSTARRCRPLALAPPGCRR